MCKNALVVGAGPLGILATAALTLAHINIFTSDIFPEDHPKVRLVKGLGATYVDASKKTAKEVAAFCCASGTLDIIFEASGAAASAKDIKTINSRFEGLLGRMITHRYQLEEFEQAFTPKDSGHIKTVIEVEPW